jgi:hypothetical protein
VVVEPGSGRVVVVAWVVVVATFVVVVVTAVVVVVDRVVLLVDWVVVVEVDGLATTWKFTHAQSTS